METEISSLAKALKVLGDNKRFMILRLLLEYDLCVEALSRRLDISTSAVSQHLKVLREEGLVRGEKRGYFTHYSVERERIREIASQLEAMTAIPLSRCLPGPECGGPAPEKE